MASNSLKNPGILWLRKSGNPEFEYAIILFSVPKRGGAIFGGNTVLGASHVSYNFYLQVTEYISLKNILMYFT